MDDDGTVPLRVGAKDGTGEWWRQGTDRYRMDRLRTDPWSLLNEQPKAARNGCPKIARNQDRRKLFVSVGGSDNVSRAGEPGVDSRVNCSDNGGVFTTVSVTPDARNSTPSSGARTAGTITLPNIGQRSVKAVESAPVITGSALRPIGLVKLLAATIPIAIAAGWMPRPWFWRALCWIRAVTILVYGGVIVLLDRVSAPLIQVLHISSRRPLARSLPHSLWWPLPPPVSCIAR